MTVTIDVSDGTIVTALYVIQTIVLIATYLVIRSRLTVVAGVIVELGRRFGAGAGGVGGGAGSWKTIAAQAVAPMLPELLRGMLGPRPPPGGRD